MIKKLIPLLSVLIFLLYSFVGCAIPEDNSAQNDDAEQGENNSELPFDYESLVNDISAKAVLFNVKIISEHSPNSFFGFGTKEMSSGSGVIYRKEGEIYYALTNDHVVSTDKDSSYKSEYFVYDAFGNKYTAALVVRDESCDLAVVKFRGNTETELGTVKLASNNAEEKTKIISLGNPGGQFNSTTLGEILGMQAVEPGEGDGKIYFPVVIHTAPLDPL